MIGPAKPPTAKPIELKDRARARLRSNQPTTVAVMVKKPARVAPTVITAMAKMNPAWFWVWDMIKKPMVWATAPMRMISLVLYRLRATPRGTFKTAASALRNEEPKARKVLDQPNWRSSTTARLP